MWKKVLIALIAMVGTFSVGYAFYNLEMIANNQIVSKQTAPVITGRIGAAKQGDRYYIGTKYSNTDIDVQLVKQQSNKSWFSMNATSFGSSIFGASYNLSESDLYTHVSALNDLINTNNKSKKIFELHGGDTLTASRTEDVSVDYKKVMDEGKMQYFFIPTENEIGLTSCLNITGAGADPYGLSFTPYYFAYNEMYFNSWIWHSSANFGSGTAANAINKDGNFVNIWGKTDYLPMRFSALINMEEQVFAVEQGINNQTLVQIQNPKYSDGSAMYSASGSTMKTRIKNSGAPLTIDFTKLTQTFSEQEITKVENTAKIRIHYNNATTGNHKVSLLIKENNEYKYYYVLGNVDSSGQGYFDFDTSQLANGEYEFSLVNEEYSNDLAPVYASDITQSKSIEIVDSHAIAYTKQPQSGASAGNDYEYDKNVNSGQIIGKLTVNPTGLAPLTYEVIGNGDDTYKNFELDGLDASGTSSATSLNVSIKSNAPDLVNGSLKAGDYKFCITSTDMNGYPDVQNENTRVCTTLTVKKITPTVSFKTTAQTKIKIGNTVGIEEFIDTTNTDITAGGSYDPDYILSGGVTGTGLDIVNDPTDPKKFKIVIGSSTSATLPATFKLKVTLPETDNYESVTSSEKEIYVYKGLSSLIWTPTKTGSYAIEDVTSGKIVGTLLASDGIANYTYSLTTTADSGYDATKAKNNAEFSVDTASLSLGTKANVKTSKTLGAGTYYLQFKVLDQAGDEKYIDAVIEVSANAQKALSFIENGKSITTKTLYYDDTNVTIQAEGGEISITTLPTYALSNPSDSAFVTIKDNGNGTATLTPVKVTDAGTTIKIKATKKGNNSYSDVSTELSVTILKARQTLAFDDTNLTKRVRKGSASFLETATGALTASKKPGVGGITYSSSAPSIITIDPDTGEVTVGNTGTATITAVLNDPKSNTYDANYETKTITKTIEVYEGMSVTFTPSSLQAEKTATLNGTAGTLTPSNNNGSVSYKISSSTDPKNVDASWFKLNGSTLQLSKAVSGSDLSKHVGGNTFKVQVDVTDQDGTITVDCVITISDAENDFYFVNPNNVTEKITSISEAYGIGKTIQLQTHTSNGKPVTYKLKDGQDSSIISIAQDGTVTILKAGGPIKAEATVAAGSGYAGKTIELSITITVSTQTIAFDKATNESIQFVKDTSYATPATLKEADGTQSTRLIQYSSETTSICTIDSTGNITMLTTGDCKIKAENKDHNYTSVSTSKTITLYDGMGGNFTQGTTPQAEETNAQSGSPIGSVSVSGGQGAKTYSVSSNTQDNSEKDFFTITSAGVVSLKKNITAHDLASLSQDHDGNYIMHVVFTAKDTLNNTVEIKAEIKVKGAKLNAEFDTGGTGMITKPYSPNGTFLTEIINNNGNGTPVYRLKTGNDIPADVLQQIDSGTGIVTIENAVEGTKYAYIQAEIPAHGGYCAATIEVPVNITKAEQDFKFKKKVINLQTESSMELEVEGILSKQADGTLMDWTMASQDTSLVKVNGHSITGTKKEGSTTITASVKGDRNYKAGSDTITINVSSAPAYDFSITVPNATYGDTGLIGEVFTDEGIGANKKQVWTSSDESVAIIDPDTGELTILKAGKTTITCTQTSDGEPSVSATATFVVDPKPISITIDDATKKVGEALPQFNAVMDPNELVGSDTIGQPIFSCKDRDNKSITNLSPAGEYEITGSYPTGANPNYEITVTPGKLTVTQDESNDTWYELIGKDSGNNITPDTWVGEEVYVSLKKTESDPYDQISLNQSNWDSEHILVETEGITTSNVYFQKSDTKAQATNQSTTIKIDHTKPEITSITGEPIEQSAISKLLEVLTFGNFFKPQDEITIQAKDIQPKGVSDISGLKEVNYKIYPINKQTGLPETEVYDKGTVTANMETIKFKVEDIGIYRICATTSDHAGNTSTTKCSDINVKEIDVDKDGDGIPDMNDSDNDGCPDLNIVLGTDQEGNKVKLNVAEKDKKYPYMNIDSDGDGIADLNVDTDHDGKPDLNLVILTEKDWKPKTCVIVDQLKDYSNPVEYCTGTDVKAQINVDTDGDGIPNINIDTNGDMIADFNIDTNGDGKPDLNIGKVHETWTPNKDDCVKDGFAFDTATDGTPLINIDTNGDGLPDVNVDLTGDGKADINIDLDGDFIPDIDIDSTGDGKPNLNVDTTGDGKPNENIIELTEWTPEKKVEGEIPYGTMELEEVLEMKDNGIIITKPSGGFLPNHAIKVTDISDTLDEEVKSKLDQVIGEKEIKKVYDVEYIKDHITTQPDGTIIMKIPVVPDIQNPKVMIEQEDGTFKEVSVKEEDGYYVFETAYVGKVSVLGDKESSKAPDPKPTPEPNPTDDLDPNPKQEAPTQAPEPVITNNNASEPTVQGTYVKDGMGGARTGDTSNLIFYLGLICFSLGVLCLIHHHKESHIS